MLLRNVTNRDLTPKREEVMLDLSFLNLLLSPCEEEKTDETVARRPRGW
jgi:hypothetical protein